MGLSAIFLLLLMAQADTVPEYARIVNASARLIQENRFDLAIQELKRAAALEPRSPAVHFLLGQAYLAKGAPEFVAEAKAEFQQALHLDPDHSLASYHIAKIDLDLGRIARAEHQLQRAIERKPGEHYLLALLGELRRQQGRPDEALGLLNQALAKEPAAVPTYYYRALAFWDQKDEQHALADLNRVITSPWATVEAYQMQGAIHLYYKRFAEAEASLRKALERGPDRAEPHLRLAQVMRLQRRYEPALRELARVEAAAPLSSPYFQRLLADTAFERGLILTERGDITGAREAFRKAIEIDPSHEEARRQLRP